MRVAFLFEEKYPNFDCLCKVFNSIDVNKIEDYETYVRAGIWGFNELNVRSIQGRQEFISRTIFTRDGNYFRIKNSDALDRLVNSNIYVVQFDCIKKNLINDIHKNLLSENLYLGFTEVLPENKLHFRIFNSYGRVAKIENKKFNILYIDGLDGEELVDDILEWANEHYGMLSLYFNKKDIGMRFTAFDVNENPRLDYDLFRSIDILKEEFQFRNEEVLHKLLDIAPDSAKELITGIISLDREVISSSECAQIATNFRRSLEKLADIISPSKSSSEKQDYKGRLKRYILEKLAVSKFYGEYLSTEIDEILLRLEKVYNMGNKGIHEDWLHPVISKLALRLIILFNDLIMPQKLNKPSVYFELPDLGM